MPGIYNFIVQKGETFNRSFTWKDATSTGINLTDYTIQIQIIPRFIETPAVITLNSDTEIVKADQTLYPGKFTLEFLVDSDIYTFNSAKYELNFIKDSKIKRPLIGIITINDEVPDA